jgi:hypothetical protein
MIRVARMPTLSAFLAENPVIGGHLRHHFANLRAMIERDVTLILGAGASQPYGFPSGSDLVEQVLLLKPELRPLEDTARVGNFGVDIGEFGAFRDALRASLVTSVDAFLETRRDHMKVGKRVIAGLLLPHENPDRIRVNVKGGWYDYLVNLLHAPTAKDWKKNKLKIITFNYDRSLEFALWGALRARYSLSADDALELMSTIPIVHVYGSLGTFATGTDTAGRREYTPIATSATIASAAEQIQILHELEDDSASIQSARALLRQSEKIAFLGFGYHPMNVRRLALQATVRTRAQIWGSGYGFTREEWRSRVAPQFQNTPAGTSQIPQFDEYEWDTLTWLRSNVHLFE